MSPTDYGYDPKLRAAAEEIKQVMKKHDIAGFVGLFSISHAEFVFEIESSWSIAKWKRDPETGDVQGFRFSVRKNKKAEGDATAGLFCNMRDLSARFFQYADNAIKLLEQHMKIDHEVGVINTNDLVPPNATIVSFPGGVDAKKE